MSTPDIAVVATEEDLKAVIEHLMAKAKELTDLASEFGFTMTISTVPKLPLAMGNYEYQAELRVHHDVYREWK